MRYKINPLRFYKPKPGYPGEAYVAIEILRADEKQVAYTVIPLSIWTNDAALMDLINSLPEIEQGGLICKN